MVKIKTLFVVMIVGFLGLFPLAAPAQATHNCGFEPCPHPDDAVVLLCSVPILNKYLGVICP